MKGFFQFFKQWLGYCLLAFLALQIFFALRIAAMRWVDPASTSFERSERVRLALQNLDSTSPIPWQQEWVAGKDVAVSLERAVIACEDGGFLEHEGVDWEAIEKAWEKNERNEKKAQKAQRSQGRQPTSTRAAPQAARARPVRPVKVYGGSTLTQQLAKNLFLSGERSFLRKGQELVIALMLETLLSKQRILEIYINHVEWGEGVFGVQAAARHYFHKPAARLRPEEAARLALMLPRPKYFYQRPNAGYLFRRSAVVLQRMGAVALPH